MFILIDKTLMFLPMLFSILIYIRSILRREALTFCTFYKILEYFIMRNNHTEKFL